MTDRIVKKKRRGMNIKHKYSSKKGENILFWEVFHNDNLYFVDIKTTKYYVKQNDS